MAARKATVTASAAEPSWVIDPVLSVEHLTMRFGGLVAVGDLSFNVGRGDITALIGPNGAGKTTVFNCVTGFYKPTEGRIVMRHGPGRQDGDVAVLTDSGMKWRTTEAGAVYLLERMPDHEIAHRARVARTFQNIRLFGGMTVLENLLVAQHNPLMVASGLSIGGILGLPSYKKAQKEAIDKSVYWLEHTGLIDRADDPAADLPYGAQRRLEIARAMCTGPELLCLDEPAAGLNPRESSELNALLKYIRDRHGVSVLLIEHDMGVVMEISDHVVVLDYGVKISDGAAAFVKNDPKVIAAYLGVDDEAEIDVAEIRKDVAKIAKPPRRKASTTRAKKAAGKLRKPAKPAKPASAARKPTASRAASASVSERAGAASAKKAAAKSRAPSQIRIANAGDYPGTQPNGTKKPRAGGANNLTRIKGIGPANEKKLNGLGIWHFDQIAAWKKREVEWVGSYLAFPGRIEREDWVKQAKVLARGGETAFSKRVDKGEVPTSVAGRRGARPKTKTTSRGGKA